MSDTTNPLRERLVERVRRAVSLGDGPEEIVDYAVLSVLAEHEAERPEAKRLACIEDGGHFWPPCDDGTKPPTCMRCGYNPGWEPGTADECDDAAPAKRPVRVSEEMIEAAREAFWEPVSDPVTGESYHKANLRAALEAALSVPETPGKKRGA